MREAGGCAVPGTGESLERPPGGQPTKASPSRLRADLVALFDAAVRAVDPARLVASCLERRGDAVILTPPAGPPRRWRGPTLVLGAGKAAARMAAGCERALGAATVTGEVIVADGCEVTLRSVSVSAAGHPLPDTRGAAATARLVQRLQAARGGVLCLISGGASSLLVAPRAPVTLADKIRVNELLLACGANIDEINTVRKHISEVKGGGLLRHAAGPVVSLILSDVVGDAPATIGSGPAVPDPTTFADAYAVLERHALLTAAPRSVIDLLEAGRAGEIAETPKPADLEAQRALPVLVGSNRTALEGAGRAARGRGWRVVICDAALSGETDAAARRFAAAVRAARQDAPRAPLCVLAGGETTVVVRGRGRGGRNQEFALALARELAGTEAVALSAGTDGIDGPTDAAGAFADGATLERARRRGLDADAALAANDCYPFFQQLDDLFRCGPTGTNVMDVKIVLVPALPGPA